MHFQDSFISETQLATQKKKKKQKTPIMAQKMIWKKITENSRIVNQQFSKYQRY